MSRETPVVMSKQRAAASAGTLYMYYSVPVPFMFEGFAWGYQTAEANTDNTLDFVIERDQDKDGTFDATGDAIFTNGNANGLLDTTALGKMVTNMGNAASGGATAIAVTPTRTRIAAGETIRVTLVTAGTGTIPAINFDIIGKYLQPLV